MGKLLSVSVLAVGTIAFVSGCVPSSYTKEIVVHKDANGRVIESWEKERFDEVHQDSAKVTPIGNTSLTQVK